MKLLEAIRKKLLADAVANQTTWKCYIGYTPDDQDRVLSLTLTGGYPRDTLGGENLLPTFQVTVRAGYLERAQCETKWWEVFTSLQEGDPAVSGDGDLSEAGVILIEPQNTGPLEWLDAKNRCNMSLNYRVVMSK